MKKFKGTRKLEDIIKKSGELGFEYYELNFQQRFKKGDLDICLRSFGKFFVYDKDNNCIASENSKELDHIDWYNEILELFYIPVDEAI